MDVTLHEVSSEKELRAFIQFPFSLYRGSPNWVPPLLGGELASLRRDRNPAFESCQARYWLARRQDRIVGRIAAILNRQHIEKWGQRYLRFGWVDFIDDPQVSTALLTQVEDWARQENLQAVHGPLGFSNMDHAGMLVEGFDELSTMATIYNYPYYPAHMERLGYVKDTDWLEYEITLSPEPNPTIARIADLALRRHRLQVLYARSKRQLLPYARELFRIYNAEYRKLYAAVPLSEAQVEAAIHQYLGLISPKFVPVVLDEHGRMVAFGIVMPSLSHALQKAGGRLLPFGFLHLMRALRRNTRADLYLVAVRGEYQGKGVNAILMDRVHRLFLEMGIRKIETNPELEQNSDVQGQWKYYEKRQHKRRRCFIKPIPQ